MLAKRGYQVTAFDPSLSAVQLARCRAELAGEPIAIHQADLFGFSLGQSFDAIVCMDVLEHIDDDVRAVERLSGWLTDRGVLCVAVPALETLYGYHDEELGHYRRYSRQSLTTLLASSLEVEQCRFFGVLLIPVALLFSRILRRPYPVGKASGPVARRFFSLEKHWQPPCGTSLLALARMR